MKRRRRRCMMLSFSVAKARYLGHLRICWARDEPNWWKHWLDCGQDASGESRSCADRKMRTGSVRSALKGGNGADARRPAARRIVSGAFDSRERGDGRETGCLLSRDEETRRVRKLAAELHIAAKDLELPVTTLSGGNQQKVLLARCLMCSPSVLLMDEPTRGVDVGAKAEIYGILRELAAKGLSIVFTSSEIEETRALARSGAGALPGKNFRRVLARPAKR